MLDCSIGDTVKILTVIRSYSYRMDTVEINARLLPLAELRICSHTANHIEKTLNLILGVLTITNPQKPLFACVMFLQLLNIKLYLMYFKFDDLT